MSQNLKFVTAISGHTTKGLLLRNQPLLDLISEADFVSTLFLSLTGKKPKKNEKKILNAILVASIDHGINPASGFVPRVVASSGNDILTCMASALLALGPYHGGAITNAMNVLKEIAADGDDKEQACERMIDSYRLEKRRIPGFGHPKYRTVDPRAKVLFEMARKDELDIEYMNLAKQLEHSLEQKLNKKLVLNIDGAIAALLLTLGIDPIAGNAMFGVARVAGSIAHIVEEQKSGSWVRRIPEDDVEFAPE
ncbi:MAG: citryl-CoA lyase [Patescibacteria group bacterium]|nr:MAG: citryl-CoA lyase [Patescibacteria group bacterium]